jgi:tetratricopeptide (TPR) repeat protein
MEETKILTDSERFIKCNQVSFQELLTFIDFAEADKFTLGFIEINFPPEVDILVDRLRQHFPEEEVQFEVFSFPDPGLRFLRDALKEEMPKRNIDLNKKTVLIIRDLEYSIGVYGNYPPVLADLNYVRNAYKLYVPHPMLFILPDFAITRTIRFAPDFWDWRSCFFRFKTTQETRGFFENKTLKLEHDLENLKVLDKQETIDSLHRLLMEYYPTGQQVKEEDTIKYSETLYRLGKLYETQGNYARARIYLEDVLKFSTRKENFKLQNKIINLLIKCDYQEGKYQQAMISSKQVLAIAREILDPKEETISLNHLGNIYSSQGDYNKAIEYYQQSLAIQQEIGDRYGIAVSLNNLGNVCFSQGNYNKAIKYYQQSLEIKQKINDRYGLAASLNNLGNIYDSQGDYNKAMEYYQQSLKIQQEIGDRYGIAMSLSNLGNVYKSQEEYNKAIKSYQQSLEIRQEIGDRIGLATSLNNLGNIYCFLDRYNKALQYYQQSLEIQQEIGNPKGISTSLNNLGNIYACQGELKQAIKYYKQSLEIARNPRDCHKEAMILSNLGAIYKISAEYPLAIDAYNNALYLYLEMNIYSKVKQIEAELNNLPLLLLNKSIYDINNGNSLSNIVF